MPKPSKESHLPLQSVYDGWDGYQTSLVHAVAPLTTEQMRFRPAPQLRSLGEVAAHIAVGRVSWFHNMGAPGSAGLAERAAALGSEALIAEDAAAAVRWLEDSWEMIALTLRTWTVADLAQTYRHAYWGKTYAVSRQWTIWRILTHDVHHGGELALMLGMLGVEAPELGALGGHLTIPPLAEEE